METTTFKNNKYTVTKKIAYIFSVMLLITSSFAQLQNNGTIYVKNNSTLFLKSNTFNFGATSTTQTSRNGSTNSGKLVFGSAASFSASSSKYVDGYVETLSTNPFIMYVGQNASSVDYYAPIRVESAAAVKGVFVRANPTTINASVDAALGQISTTEYWGISGTSARISLSWRSNTVTGFTSSDYTIAGFDGISWKVIPSTIDQPSFLTGASTVSAGSITSNAAVNLSTFSFFTIGTKGAGSCPPVIATASGNIVRWDGTSWLNGIQPTENDEVFIDSTTPSSPGSFTCFSLVLSADITLADNQFIDCVNGVSGPGKIILASKASFVQRNTNPAIAPNIVFNKKTQPMRRFDYTYRGHPVTGDSFSENFNARAIDVNGVVIGTESAFDLYYQYNSGTNGGWTSISSTTPGRGFISRVKPVAPFTTASATSEILMPVNGVANNGDITVSVQRDETAVSNDLNSYNIISNPYPSVLDGDKFLAENVGVDGALYIYTSATPFPGTGNYNPADFIIYTRLGTTNPNILATFDGKLSSAQGFQVRALADGTVTFTNCMRLKDNTGVNFYKSNASNATNLVDRFKLRLTNSSGVYNEMMVGYLPEGTLGYDRMYDATANSASTAQLYSIMDNSDKKLAINARPIFNNTDVVPVGFKKNNSSVETFTIALTNKEGIFNTSNVVVYLHDTVLNTYHDLNASNFTLTTADTEINNRYRIVYQNVALSNPDFSPSTAVVVLDNNTLSVKSTNAIKSISIYDITGRLIENYNSVNSNEFDANFNHEESIYIARIFFENGAVNSQKLIHTKN